MNTTNRDIAFLQLFFASLPPYKSDWFVLCYTGNKKKRIVYAG